MYNFESNVENICRLAKEADDIVRNDGSREEAIKNLWKMADLIIDSTSDFENLINKQKDIEDADNIASDKISKQSVVKTSMFALHVSQEARDVVAETKDTPGFAEGYKNHLTGTKVVTKRMRKEQLTSSEMQSLNKSLDKVCRIYDIYKTALSNLDNLVSKGKYTSINILNDIIQRDGFTITKEDSLNLWENPNNTLYCASRLDKIKFFKSGISDATSEGRSSKVELIFEQSRVYIQKLLDCLKLGFEQEQEQKEKTE